MMTQRNGKTCVESMAGIYLGYAREEFHEECRLE